MPDGPLDISELGGLVKERREVSGLGLRDAAAEAGVSFNTLSRIERGHIPDLGTFRRIVDWLGIDPAQFFAPPERRFEPTPDLVAQHLRHDPALSDEAAAQIADLVRTMYTSLAQPPLELAVHLRAAHTFKPAAADLLADLLQEMQAKLDVE
jgi:transcriptional regulator with XRE-family HTH domain